MINIKFKNTYDVEKIVPTEGPMNTVICTGYRKLLPGEL